MRTGGCATVRRALNRVRVALRSSTYAMYQMGGRYWTDWSKKLNDAVVKTQRSDANFKGSWDPLCVWGEDGGRVYSTAILVLTLEAYYRYTKLVR